MDQGWKVGTILGFPVRVHPSALILVAFLLLPYLRAGAVSTAIGLVAAVGISVLMHELGHAYVIRSMGWDSVIVLHGFGGVTLSRSRPSPGQQVGISLAGPAVNLALIGVSFVLLLVFPGGALGSFFDFLFTVNLFLALFNLLPIFPLDGGQAFRAVVRIFSPAQATLYTSWVSVVLAGGLGVYGYASGSLFMAIIALFLISQNFRGLGGVGPETA